MRLWVIGLMATGALVLGGNAAVLATKSGSPLVSKGFVREREQFTGEVEEELSAGSYTYFSLRLPNDEQRWVVVLGRTHRGAKWLRVTSYGNRRGFSSKRLERAFDRLFFVSVVEARR